MSKIPEIWKTMAAFIFEQVIYSGYLLNKIVIHITFDFLHLTFNITHS